MIEQQREARRRREHVVGRLRHVHVIVRMHLGVRALRRAEHFRGAVGEHLVGVHVVRRAGARLIHVDDELIAQLAGKNFVGGGHDGAADVGGQLARGLVGGRRGFLDEDGGGDELVRRAQAADRKIFDGPLGLDPVVRIRGHGVFAERIALYAMHRVRFHLIDSRLQIPLSILPGCFQGFSTACST